MYTFHNIDLFSTLMVVLRLRIHAHTSRDARHYSLIAFSIYNKMKHIWHAKKKRKRSIYITPLTLVLTVLAQLHWRVLTALVQRHYVVLLTCVLRYSMLTVQLCYDTGLPPVTCYHCLGPPPPTALSAAGACNCAVVARTRWPGDVTRPHVAALTAAGRPGAGRWRRPSPPLCLLRSVSGPVCNGNTV